MKEFESTERTLAHFWTLYDQGDGDQAEKLIGPAAELLAEDGMPSHRTAPILELLGLILHDRGRSVEAADLIEKAGLVVPLRGVSRVALASCYADLGKIDLARELYLQLALRRELPPTAMLQVAAGLEAIDAPQLAMQVCEWVTERDETIAQAYYDMGVYSARSGRPLYLSEALTHRAIQLDPGNIHYRIGLASLMIQLDRDGEAIAALGSLTVQQIASVKCPGRLHGDLPAK